MPTKPPPPRYLGGWQQTGRWRWRDRFLRGPFLEVEMERWVWDPIITGSTPDRWRHETIWWKGESWHDYPEGMRV